MDYIRFEMFETISLKTALEELEKLLWKLLILFVMEMSKEFPRVYSTPILNIATLFFIKNSFSIINRSFILSWL